MVSKQIKANDKEGLDVEHPIRSTVRDAGGITDREGFDYDRHIYQVVNNRVEVSFD